VAYEKLFDRACRSSIHYRPFDNEASIRGSIYGFDYPYASLITVVVVHSHEGGSNQCLQGVIRLVYQAELNQWFDRFQSH
jgi:hypothetical protein